MYAGVIARDIIKAVSYAFWTSTRDERSATYLFQGIVQIFPASGACPSLVQRGDSFSIFRRYSTVGISKKKKRYAVLEDAILAWHFLLARTAKHVGREREERRVHAYVGGWVLLGLHHLALTTCDYYETTD